MPGGVTAASMTEAGDMPDEDLIWAERVPVRASARRLRHRLSGGRVGLM
jgi:hypothetical protein